MSLWFSKHISNLYIMTISIILGIWQENVDSQERLGEIIKGLGLIGREFSLPVVFPVHPRTRKDGSGIWF